MWVNNFSCVRCFLSTEHSDSHVLGTLLVLPIIAHTGDFWGQGSGVRKL